MISHPDCSLLKDLVKGIPKQEENASVNVPPQYYEPFKSQLSNKISIDAIKIAVIDSGCCWHDDLGRSIDKISSISFVEGEKWHDDESGHGTYCCGIIAGKNDVAECGMGNKFLSPIMFKPSLLVVKVLDKNGEGSFDALNRGIQYAISQKVDIICISLSARGFNKPVYLSIMEAISKDILVLAAAGNEAGQLAFPATIAEVITVGSVDSLGNSSHFTIAGAGKVDICGPGEKILSTHKINEYIEMSGTSPATPVFTAICALLLANERRLFQNNLTNERLLKNNHIMKNFLKQASSEVIGNDELFLSKIRDIC